MAFSVETALTDYVRRLEIERQPDGTWHPSSISGCPRKSVYEFTGVPKSNPHDDRSSRIFRVGHILHEFVQTAIAESEDVELFYPEVKIFTERPEDGENDVSGSVDGLVKYRNGTWEVLEFKTINSNAFKYGDLPKEDHKVQASVYLWSLRRSGGLAGNVVIPPLGNDLTRARFVYISKDDLRIEESTMLWTEAKATFVNDRLELLDHHVQNETLPDRLPFMEKKGQLVKDYRCGYCPFKDTCWEDA